MLAQCEYFYGAAWVHNPARWATADGYVPYAVLVAAWHALASFAALERLSTVKALMLARPRREEEQSAIVREFAEEEQLAYPE